MGEPIRVLQVLGGTGLGGAESRVMDLYRNMDRTKVQFDFAVHTEKKGFFDAEIEALGGRIYRLPRFRFYNWYGYQHAWNAFFAAHPGYACVHGHMTSTASIYLPIAKKAGVGLTLAHARSAGVDDGVKGWLTCKLRDRLADRADYCLAASALAGKAVFGQEAWQEGRVHVLPNAIQTARFCYDPIKREQLRDELALRGAFVAGHVGRFHPCKNHGFLLEVFAAVCKENPNSRLLLLGEGGGMDAVKEKAKALGVADRTLFLGNRENVADYYQAMDCFVFPSLYEGFPGTVLEAQTTGLPCVIADTITREVGLTELVHYLPLSASPKQWAGQVLAARETKRCGRADRICRCGYDAALQASYMQQFYETGKLPAGMEAAE